jgi:hypothetical protein
MALDSPILTESDAGFIGFASRLNPLSLPAGMLQDSVNMRLDRGVAQTRKGAKRLADDVDNSATSPLIVDDGSSFTLGTDKAVTSITRASATATATLTAHGYTTADTINIRGATQTEYNGDYVITVTGANTFTYVVSGTPATPATGTIIANKGPIIESSYGGGIFALGVFSSVNYDNAREYVVMVSGAKAYLWRDGAKPTIKYYPTSADEVVEEGDEVSVMQAFNRLYILREAPLWGPAKGVTSITSASTTATVTCSLHSFANGQTVRIDGASPSGYNGTYTIAYVDQNTFTYTLPASIATAATGTITAEGATEYAAKSVTSGGITVSTTTATVNLTAHGYPVGATVRIEGSTTPAFDGVEHAIVSVATNSFTVTVPSGTAADTTLTGRTVRRVKPPIYWDGGSGNFVRAARGIPAEGVTFRRMQSLGWATYFNNRVWAPDGRDSVMISDVLDPDLFDPFFSSFRANQGSSDYIVGIHPWVEGQALVFLRNSIWMAELGQTSSSDGSDFVVDAPVSKLTLLTDEVGCVARKSIQTAGQYVYFLSDAGVYRLDSQLDLKLRGDTRPLSDPIADRLENLTGDQAYRAIGKWFNNRYWLSVPQDVDGGIWNLFIFNALNQQWETKDVYDFSIEDMLVTLYGGERRLFAGSFNGRLFLLDELETGDMTESGSNIIPVAGSFVTRRYHMGDLRPKRFNRVIMDALIPHTGSMTLRGRTTNPDRTSVLLSQDNFSGEEEDYTLKAAVRSTANYLDVLVETSANRPSIRAVTVEAAGRSLPATDTKTNS